MLQTLSFVKVLSGAAIDDNSKIYCLGANQNITLSAGSTGGGSYSASATPRPDRMRVQCFQATVADANSRILRGVRVVLGLLTDMAQEPVVFLHAGVVGDEGQEWVTVPFKFVTGNGLVVQLPFYLPSATYHLKARASYERT